MVSIIIATYNSEKTLRRAMESVLHQDYQDWECIVVDGASKDATMDIVREFAEKDPRFRSVSEPDRGIYDAFNKGWKLAKGEWVMYLGSDDEYTKEGLKQLYDNTQEYDVVYGDTILKYRNGQEKLQRSKNFQVLKNSHMPSCHQSLAMKREAISKMGGFDETYKILADFDLVCKSYFAKFRFGQKQIPVAKFYLGGISQGSYDAVFEHYKITKKYHNQLFAYLSLWKELLREFLVHIKHHIDRKQD